MSSEEIRLARMWSKEDKMKPKKIANLLHRDKSTLTRLLVMKTIKKGRGRRRILTEAQVDRLVIILENLINKATARYEVTLQMLLRAARWCKARPRTVRDALYARNIYFRRMRSKPVLTPEDVKVRYKFSKDFSGKPAPWWTSNIEMHIDVKHFPVSLHGEAREDAAQKGTRGAYRAPGKGLAAPYVKRDTRLKYNSGARGVKVMAGVGQEKVLVWEYIDGQNWSGAVAAEMYRGPIHKALLKAHPP